MQLLRALEQRQCNGHAKVKLGTALADPEKFRNIFTQYSRGTYFEGLDLDLEEVEPVVACPCGYRAYPRSPTDLDRCPMCGGAPELERGTEFEVLEP